MTDVIKMPYTVNVHPVVPTGFASKSKLGQKDLKISTPIFHLLKLSCWCPEEIRLKTIKVTTKILTRPVAIRSINYTDFVFHTEFCVTKLVDRDLVSYICGLNRIYKGSA